MEMLNVRRNGFRDGSDFQTPIWKAALSGEQPDKGSRAYGLGFSDWGYLTMVTSLRHVLILCHAYTIAFPPEMPGLAPMIKTNSMFNNAFGV